MACQTNMADVAKEEAIKYLFYKGNTYKEMVGVPLQDSGLNMSLNSLKRWLKAMNLSKK